jgi:hypothetical protein
VRLVSPIRLGCAGLAALPAAAVLSGCVTTQDLAARAQLVDARIRAGEVRLRVGSLERDVRVTALTLLRVPDGTAIVAELRNTSARALTDLPVLVGVRTGGGRELYLNRAANTGYLGNHLVAIGAGQTVTWVFTSHRRLASPGRPFAEVGTTQIPEPAASALPRFEVTSVRASTSATLSLAVANRSGITQNGLPVYAVAIRGGRVTAAGRALVTLLGAHETAQVRLTVLGRDAGAAVQLSALPTIFH